MRSIAQVSSTRPPHCCSLFAERGCVDRREPTRTGFATARAKADETAARLPSTTQLSAAGVQQRSDFPPRTVALFFPRCNVASETRRSDCSAQIRMELSRLNRSTNFVHVPDTAGIPPSFIAGSRILDQVLRSRERILRKIRNFKCVGIPIRNFGFLTRLPVS
eukprot:COSAG02_NODE_1027_length_15115_cov_118.186867_7_plen_163_part_00